MGETIKGILENNHELQKEYNDNVFLRVAIDSVISDPSPSNILKVIHLLSNELKHQFNQKEI